MTMASGRQAFLKIPENSGSGDGGLVWQADRDRTNRRRILFIAELYRV